MFALFKRANQAEVIDGARARQLIAAGARIIDVRSPKEFAGGHIDGAINVPVQDIETGSVVIDDDQQPTVLYCRSGQRSARAGARLKAMGHHSVYDLGPMSAW